MYCQFCNHITSVFKKELYDTRFGIKDNFDVYKCKSCGIYRTKIDYFKYDIKGLYRCYYNSGIKKQNRYTKLRTVFFNNPFYRLWVLLDGDISFHFKRGKGRLIDVGCNEGRNLPIYENNGFSVEGLDVNERAITEAKKNGHKIHNYLLEDFQPNKSFDVVVLANVLEHSLEPVKFLKNINRILKPGGKVWISTPNIESWQRKFFGRFWINWHIPFHVFFFSDSTISTLLTNSGFGIIKSFNSTPSLWMAQSIIATLFTKIGKKNNPQRFPLLLGCLLLIIRFFLFPVLCIGNLIGRGDCLIIEAFKKDSI
jgi:2-polyprenyl-3-methyl-5-hydroxy-6-metoxy-1,4-benzoquinol methylase